MSEEVTNNMMSSVHVKPNPVLVARQIKNLREVLRRMRVSAQAAALDPVINRKLQQLMRS